MAPAAYDIKSCELEVSKHFKTKWMRKWNWDYIDLREALSEARVEKMGKTKYEAYCTTNRKVIFVYYLEFETIFVISGSEG